MKLSIYVNLRSIAWIVSDGEKVIDFGIKRVNTDFDTYYEFLAGNPVSKRINRRAKRSARRNRWRRQSRREGLINYLNKLGYVPDREYSAKEMYELRVKALSEKVSDAELGAIFLSLQKKRGYKNMRGVSAESDSDYLKTIAEHEENLKSYKSIAEYLLTKESAKNIIFTRESYEKEFSDICKAQGINDINLYNLLYFQRNISKKSTAYCFLEKSRKVCHYSHPDFQEFRIWRDVMNIEITDPNLNKLEIPFSQREKWIENLMNGQDLTKAKCCKDLGFKKSTGFSWLSGLKIAGNVVVKMLKENNFELWQDLFSATEDKRLIKLLEKKYPNHDHERLMDVDFNSYGHTEFSHKAVLKLLPELKKGKKLKEAILNVYGVVNVDSDISLRNYVLEQHYDSYVSLVEAVKTEYTITETAIEISHLLKAGNKARKEMAKRKRAKSKEENDYTDYQKHLLSLHKEWNGISPYEPNRKISEKELFENYNIDHIVPKSKLFEHGSINQVLCRKDLNEEKGNEMTGVEFARKLGVEDEYKKAIDNAKISERKRQFLMMETKDIPSDYLGDIDYNTRCFVKHADYVIPNKIVNRYCRQWELNNYPDADVRNTLMKCLVVANFGKESIDYFNNLKELPSTSIGRYKIKQEIVLKDADCIVYVPTIKYYRKTKDGFIPRHALHDETNYGKREELIRNTKGELKTNIFYKVRKPVAQLSKAMLGKIIDPVLSNLINERFENRDHAEVLAELKENPVVFNGKPVNSVSLRINAKDLIKVDRGYVYSAMGYCFDLDRMENVTLHNYMERINNKQDLPKNIIKQNDIVEYNGNYYFLVGVGKDVSSMMLRSVYHLGTESIKLNKKILNEAKILKVNQLGRCYHE